MTIFLSILLTILKIIGIILLVLLGLILLILLIVLFCPLNYRIKGNLKKEILTSGAHADARWLWGLVEGGADFQEKKLQVYIRIAMIRKELFGKEFGKKTEEETEEAGNFEDDFFDEGEWDVETFTEDDPADELKKTVPVSIAESKETVDKASESGTEDKAAEAAENYPNEKPEKNSTESPDENSKEKPEENSTESPENVSKDTSDTEPQKNQEEEESEKLYEKKQTEEKTDPDEAEEQTEAPGDKLKGKLSGIIAKVRQVLEEVTGKVVEIPDRLEKILDKAEKKYDSLYEKYEEAAALVGDEGNQAAVKHTLKELFHILGRYLPRKLYLDLHYSLGSPDMTAMVYGAASAIPEAYREKWKLDMDFDSEKPYGEGNLEITGRIRICVAVGAVIRLLLDRNVRKIIKMILKKRKG